MLSMMSLVAHGEQREAALPANPPLPSVQVTSSPPPPEEAPESATVVQRPGPQEKKGPTRSRDGLRAIGQDVQGAIARAIEYLDVRDGWVPIRWRGRVRGSVLVLSGALLTIAVIGGVVAIVKASSSARSSDVVASAPSVEPPATPAVFAATPAPTAAPVKEVEVKTAPPAAPRSTLATAPMSESDEGALLLESARSFTWQGRDSEAVTMVERALLRNPELRTDARVREVLLRTAHSDDKATSAATFALLEGPMVETGAELMYEISLARVGKEAARKRAQSFLRSKQFAKNAALPLFIAVRLRQAKSCEDKHALLTLAQGGGKQTLDYLRELQAHTACTPDDLVNCYPCLRADGKLSEAIAAIEKRTKG